MMAYVLLVDHFDSFTHNLAQAFGTLGAAVEVVRTNVPFADIARREPSHVVLSPGPGHPKDVAAFFAAIEHWAGKVPILGVCLGHQTIALAHGAEVVPATRLMHGKVSNVTHDGTGILAGLPRPFVAMRYHSWVVREPRAGGALSTPVTPDATFRVVALSADDGHEPEVMALTSGRYDRVWGVQFHPESYYTQCGQQLLANFLAL
jgi:anthranilate synthase/aminodeoxychorismate synthase-like glutamine amidotransferase